MNENTEDLRNRFGFMMPDRVEGYEKNGKIYIRLIKKHEVTEKISMADAEIYATGVFQDSKFVTKIKEPVDTKKPADSYICCEEMGLALDDHKALHSQTIGSMTSDSMDSIIMYKGGDYKIRNRIIVQYCPFCGKPRRRASEYKKES